MANDSLYLMVADYVPVANKGEEAIIRGIEDMLRDDRPVEIGLFDHVNEVTRQDNITIFPRRWIYRTMIGPDRRSLRGRYALVSVSMQMHLGLTGRFRNLVSHSNPETQPLREFFERSEYILVGHDGGVSLESPGITRVSRKAGKLTGILGSGQGIHNRRSRILVSPHYRQMIEDCDFCYFRDKYSLQGMREICPDSDKLALAPDPAFAMEPSPRAPAEALLEKYDAFRRAKESGRPVVGVTVLEKGVVYNKAFTKLGPEEKSAAHVSLLAELLDQLIQQRNVFAVFLPHAIESDASDIAVARRVAQAMKAAPEGYMILDEDLPARLLKAIIRECDFLIGERTHSIIGGISVATPFLALSNSSDRRTHGIVGDMSDCENQIVDLDDPEPATVIQKAIALFDNREAIRRALTETGQQLSRQLEEVARSIKSRALTRQDHA